MHLPLIANVGQCLTGYAQDLRRTDVEQADLREHPVASSYGYFRGEFLTMYFITSDSIGKETRLAVKKRVR